MLITRLKIYGYGKWLDTEINFDGPLEAIYGPNEAGKSTIIDFIISILFGFQNKRQAIHGQYIPKGRQDTYGGEISFENQGRHYRLIRTKGPKGGTVQFFDADQQLQLPESSYQQFISPLERETYQQLFYFNGEDQQTAYQMNEAELRMRIQQIGVTDADRWFDLQKSLEKQAKALYTPRGRKPELNIQLKKYQELTDQLKLAGNDYPEYQALKKSQAEVTDQIKVNQLKLKQLQKQSHVIQNQMAALPLLNKYQQLKPVNEEQLRKGFDETDVSTFQTLNSQISSYQDQLETNQQSLRINRERLIKSPSQKFYEQNQQQIDSLAAELNDIKQLLPRLAFLNEQLTTNQQQIQAVQNQLPRNRAGQLPRAFTDADLTYVMTFAHQDAATTMPHQRRRQHVQASQPVNLFYLLAGGLALAAIIFHQLPFSWLGYLVAGLVGRYGYNQQRGSSGRKEEQTVKEVASPVAEADSKLAALTNQYGLDGIDQSQWLAIQPGLKRLADLKKQQLQYTEQRDHYLKEVTQYLQKWRFASDWLPLGNDVETTIQTIDQIVAEWRQQTAAYQNRESGLAAYEQAVKHATAKLSAAQTQLEAFLRERNVTSNDGFSEIVQQQRTIRAKLTQKQEVIAQLKTVNMFSKQEIDQAEIEADAQKINSELMTTQAALTQLNQKQAQLGVRIEALINNGRYDDLKQQLANQKSEIIDNVHQYLALLLTKQWLQRVLDLATKGRLPKAVKFARKYFSILTQDHYRDIQFGDQITVTRADGETFAINELSKGTLEQLYLALIFSMAVGFSDDYPLPVIIDDGFMSFDSERKSAAFKIMTEISQRTQVLYFSARHELPAKAHKINLTKL
ncbi:ATP-binding protein [Lentilactobacillus farraginis]|uniref:DNA repair ATPase n=1 Tax=Lentilactobacillus farraginis DSM 18382 = JCM 14108 TaxID=1423743 RepID=X0QBI4_9LACO|nr:AAA family ATPase [Lentilactobacillus farraginis]KRM04282.1 DNA repair ATPase [Lentilactobacillus farraginis DSM 18382 = JCM 14108]GAF35955.1 hypothetical protein JCM14108_889 [Lentilactobacillus farraginis DSM 18382 = JCM 14108]